MIVFDAQRNPIELGGRVGQGGEASVYKISNQENRLVKVYEPEPRPNYLGKLSWMVSHPPDNPTSEHQHASLAWPDGLLFDARKKLIGYQMPYIQHAVPLLEVYNPRRRAQVLPRFNRRYLLRTAHNLAAAVGALHRSGYVAGDLNESNVLVTPTALITIIDTDSFQVREEHAGGQLVHHCPVGKPEYIPPELQGKPLSEITRLPDHDSFGLAVLIFQLLMEGSHPFRAQWLAAGDPPPLETRIANGAYPYVAAPAFPVRPPNGAPGIETLHPALAELFRRCFVDGHLDPRWRPGPELWAKELEKAEKSLVCCAQGHYYFSHLAGCPYCGLGSKGAAARRPEPASARDDRPQPRRQPRQARPPYQQPKQGTTPAGKTNAGAAPNFSPFRFGNLYGSQPGFATVNPSGSGTTAFRAAGAQGVLRSRPVFPPGAVAAWARQRAYKSFLVGGGQGALIGVLPGILIALVNWFSGDALAWGLLVSIGGVLGGLLRGWKPGHKVATLIDRYIGWKIFFEALGMIVGAAAGWVPGMLFAWAVVPLILMVVLGIQAGRYLGGKLWQFGSVFGWERIWGVVSALGFGALGFGMAQLLGLLGLNAFGADLASGLLPFAQIDSWWWAVIWGMAGGLGGAISGGMAGILTDVIGRFSGLVD